MSDDAEAVCCTCAYWDCEHALKPRGGWRVKECRRHAPVARVVAGNVFSSWPTTTEYQGCGDWEQADDGPGFDGLGDDGMGIDGWEGTDGGDD